MTRAQKPVTRGSAACYCYILECSDGSFYTGWTTNPEVRIKTHNAGHGSRYTRSRRPVRFVLLEPQNDRPGAMRRERAIKAMPRSKKLRLIGEFSTAGGGKRRNKKADHRQTRGTNR
jgi:putative endonuclease